MTDMQYSLYPTGLYDNIVRGSALKVPMYISEIGAADRSEDDHIRVTHVESFTRQVRFYSCLWGVFFFGVTCSATACVDDRAGEAGGTAGNGTRHDEASADAALRINRAGRTGGPPPTAHVARSGSVLHIICLACLTSYR